MKKTEIRKILFVVVSIIIVSSIAAGIRFLLLDDREGLEHRTIIEAQTEEEKKESESKGLSNTLPKDCKLCGDRESTQIFLYEPQDNLGIISINTFALSYIEINRYDEYGDIIEEATYGLGTYIQSADKDGFVSAVTVNVNRGYASGNIHMNQDKIIDMERVSANICEDCLNHILETVWEEPYGIGFINFKTGEIKMLEENIRGFMLGDFYILCEPRAEGDSDEISDIDLHIFYCPERYCSDVLKERV